MPNLLFSPSPVGKNLVVTTGGDNAYAILTSDELVLANISTARTYTLPTAVGVAGKIYRIKKTTNNTSLLTIATTSSQTIDGVTTLALATLNENVSLVSDNANWQIINHQYIQTPVAYTPTFTGLGTVTSINFISWRSGSNLKVFGTATTGTPTATEARISIGYNGTDGNVTSTSTLPSVQMCGKLNQASASATDFSGRTILIEASKAYITLGKETSAANGVAKANGDAVFASTTLFSCFFEVPITGWVG